MTTDRHRDFVPDGFAAPRCLEHALFTLRPLDVEHNERDYAAWTTSLEHIASTPGFVGTDWPHPMRLDENRRDLARHAADFAARRGFTYTVLDGDDVIGCVYIYPSKDAGARRQGVFVGPARPRTPRRRPLSRGARLARARLAVRARRVRAAAGGGISHGPRRSRAATRLPRRPQRRCRAKARAIAPAPRARCS